MADSILQAELVQNSGDFKHVTAVTTPQGYALLTTPGNSVGMRTMVDLDSTSMYPVPAYHQSLFGGLKTFGQYRLGDYVNCNGIDASLYAPAITAGGGAVVAVPLQSAISLTVGVANADRAFLFTKTQHRYQAGRQQSVTASVIHDDLGRANQTRRWPYFDANDGLFFALVGTVLNVVVRSSVTGVVVDVPVPQSAWNVDRLNPAFGLNPSGVTLDITKGSIYEIKFQWLGVGDVFFFVNGILVHHVFNDNALSVPYMRCPTLPLAFEVVNTAGSAAGGMRFVCGTVSSDGGEAPPQEQGSYRRAAQTVAANSEAYAFSIRLSRFYPKAGAIQNRGQVQLRLLSLASETNRASIRLLLNPVLTGATFAIDPGADIAVDVDQAATVVTGGTELVNFFAPSQGVGGAAITIDLSSMFQHNDRPLRRWSTVAADADILTVMYSNEQNGTTDLSAVLTWLETTG